MCSGASIPASEIYEAAGLLMISPYSSNPVLTELGRANVFRVVPRDDTTGLVTGNYLADHWSDKKIAILHDDTVYGKGVAELTKEQLNRRGVSEVIYRAFVPGGKDYAAEIAELQAADIDLLYIGGYPTEVALMARAAGDRGYPVQLVAGNSLTAEDFGLIAGPAAEGTLFVDVADPRGRAEAAPVVERFRASGFEPQGYTLYSYAAVQVWAQAVEKAGSLELHKMIASLRQHQFDSVLGPIAFDEKGDLTVQNAVLYVWHADGTYQPLDQAGVDQGAALDHQAAGIELAVELDQQLFGQAAPAQLAAKARQGRVIRHRVGERETDEAAERQPVGERFLEPGIGQAIPLLQQEAPDQDHRAVRRPPDGCGIDLAQKARERRRVTSAAIRSSCRLRPAPPSTSPSARLSCPSSRRIHTFRNVDHLIESRTHGYAKVSAEYGDGARSQGR
jgi:branched-chain amino acid transport system substrate-binding protein